MKASVLTPPILLMSACALIAPEDHAERLDEDQDGYSLLEDCDDQDRTVQVRTWHKDADGDGYGTTELVYACTQPLNTSTNARDCDDSNADVSPEAPEVCDGLDNDCNGLTDDAPEDADLRFRDADGDGFGDAEQWTGLCDDLAGWVRDNTDCDDSDEQIHPDAEEICENGRDDNCNDDPSECFFGEFYTASEGNVILMGESSNDGLAASFAWAGEWDDTPGEDLWVGVPGYDSARSNTGAVFLFSQEKPGEYIADPESEFHVLGEFQGDALGNTIHALPDVDGDGRSELLAQVDGAKSAILVLSSTTTESTVMSPAVTFRQTGANDDFGERMASLSDWNGDGLSEIVFGIPKYDGQDSGTGSGAVAVMSSETWSNLPMDSEMYFEDTAHTVITGQTGSDHFADALDEAGDTNGDGIPEIAVGAPEQNVDGAAQGAAYVLQPRWFNDGILKADSLASPVLGNLPGDRFGSSIAGVGDTNGDGYDDVLVGSPEADQNGRKTGAALLYLGPLADEPDYFDHESRLTGIDEKAGFGNQVSAIGDINSDGLPDIAVSAPYTDTLSHSDAGAVFLFLSPIRFNKDSDDADSVLLGDATDQLLGFHLAGAGFYDDDDRPDIAVGALTHQGASSGAAEKTGSLLLFFGIGE